MNMSPWAPGAYPAFAAARHRWGDPLAYEAGWLYLCQALRRGGWVVWNDEGWLAVARDYLGPKRHAIVVPLAEDPFQFVTAAIDFLSRRNVLVDLVKHVDERAAPTFAASTAFDAPAAESPADGSAEPLSEDRFPQVLLDVGKLTWQREERPGGAQTETLGGPEASDFRYQIRRFWRRRSEQGQAVQVESFRPMTDGEVDRLMAQWMASLRQRHQASASSRPSNDRIVYEEPVRAVVGAFASAPTPVMGETVRVDGVPRAIWLGEQVSSSCLSVYILVADTHLQNLSDFLLLRTLSATRAKRLQFVNLGGSEVSSLFTFKSKPSRSADTAERFRQVWDFATRPSAACHSGT